MSGRMADGVYSRKPWQAPPEAAYPPQQYVGPFASNQERLLSQSLAVNMMTGKEIQELVRPPLPQVRLFPERFGYTDVELGIEDIINLPGRAQQQRNETDFSQTPNTTESSSTNSLGTTI